MAIGVLEAARSRGLEAPGDLSVIGFDDINIADIHGISLTTISQKKSSMGRLAVDLIVDIMKGESDRVHKNILLEPLLVVRGSTGRPCRPGP
jgi:DNA-binding LacI/PurR family transcriptional regulator